jgi:hypothetical protein
MMGAPDLGLSLSHTGGRYKEEMEARQSKAAAAHKRYMFYFERWNAHVDSHKREQQKRWVGVEEVLATNECRSCSASTV